MSQLDKICALLGKSEGRDKIYRFYSYLLKFIVHAAKLPEKNAGQKLLLLSSNLSKVRNLMRLFSQFKIYDSIRKRWWKGHTLGDKFHTGGDILSFVFICVDFILYLCKIKVVEDKKLQSTCRIVSSLCYAGSNALRIISLALQIQDLHQQIQTLRDQNINDEQIKTQHDTALRQNDLLVLEMFRCICDLPLAFFHLDNALEMPNPRIKKELAHFLGTTSSLLAIYLIWLKLN